MQRPGGHCRHGTERQERRFPRSGRAVPPSLRGHDDPRWPAPARDDADRAGRSGRRLTGKDQQGRARSGGGDHARCAGAGHGHARDSARRERTTPAGRWRTHRARCNPCPHPLVRRAPRPGQRVRDGSRSPDRLGPRPRLDRPADVAGSRPGRDRDRDQRRCPRRRRLRAKVSWYEREAWSAARTLGWRPERVGVGGLVLASQHNAGIIDAHAEALRRRFPVPPAGFAAVLAGATPHGPLHALAFVDPLRHHRSWLLPTRLFGGRPVLPYADAQDLRTQLARR